MRRHDFEPGKLLAGLVLLAVGVTYVLDAVGTLRLRSELLLAAVPAGLCAAGLVGAVSYGARRRAVRSAEDGTRKPR